MRRAWRCRRARPHRRARGLPPGPVLALALACLAPALPAAELAGRIWVPAEERFARPAELERAVADAAIVLLGEAHPVARHHELQARLIRAAARGRRPAVVLEMLPRTAQGAIDAWRARAPVDAAAFGAAVDWHGRGWPDWSIYTPIVRAALDRDLPLYAGAPAPGELDAVGRAGLEALAPHVRAALGLDRALPRAARARLAATLRRVHCGLDTHAPVARMVAVQRLRDARMAARLLEVAGTDGAVLVAGHGHVRRDHGVPWYLARHDGDRRVVSVALLGTDGVDDTVAAHAARAGGMLPFDYVWFTAGGSPAAACNEQPGAASASPAPTDCCPR